MSWTVENNTLAIDNLPVPGNLVNKEEPGIHLQPTHIYLPDALVIMNEKADDHFKSCRFGGFLMRPDPDCPGYEAAH